MSNRSYMDAHAAVRDVVELAELALRADKLNPVINEDPECLTILFVPDEGLPFLLELERRSSGLLWVNLRNSNGELLDSWCELHIEPAGEKSVVRRLWKTARSMRVTTDTEEGLAELELLFRRLGQRPRVAS